MRASSSATVVLALALALAEAVLVGCGSGGTSGGAGVPGVARPPMVQDIVGLRQAMAGRGSREVASALRELFDRAQNRGADREGWRGSALIRRRLPQIVARFLADYARTRERLSRVRTRTSGGAHVQALLLHGYEAERRRLLQLRAIVARDAYVWGDVLRWIGANNLELARLDAQLASIVRTLPPGQRRAVDRALTEPVR